MRRTLSTILMAVVVATVLPSPAAQIRAVDAERLLVERFGFTPSEVAQARGGKAVAKLLPSNDAAEVGVFAAVRIDADRERLVRWFTEIASFRKAAELGVARRIGNAPSVTDFADLSLDATELAAIRECRPGNCDLLLGDRAIQRFQTEVDWNAPDAARRANLLMREMMLGYAQAYLKGGDQVLGAAHNDKAPRSRADDFRQLLSQARVLHDVAPPLGTYLQGFPSATLANSEQFLYWARGGAGSDASISLHQLVFYRPDGGDVFIVDKQLFATRYLDAGVVVVSLASAPDNAGFYLFVGSRGRSSLLTGMGARVLRGRVEKSIRDSAVTYLGWMRASLTM
jgi:hypothetical protein